MRPRTTDLDPVLHLLAAWKAEGASGHLVAMARQVSRELEGLGVVQRGAGSAWLRLYRRCVEDSGAPTLTTARALAELTRAGKALGLLGVLDHRRGTPPRLMSPIRRRVPMWSGPPIAAEDDETDGGHVADEADEV